MKKEKEQAAGLVCLSDEEMLNIQGGNPIVWGIGVKILWTALEDPQGVWEGFADALY